MSLYIQDIRGKVNSEISNNFSSQLGTIIGNYVGKGKYVLIGRDSRIASQMIKRSITSGLMSAGINVVDFGVAPLPSIHFSKRYFDANVIITVSESHLRGEDVNIKIISSTKIPLDQRHASKVPWNEIGELIYVSETESAYRESLINSAAPEIKNKNFLIVMDCAHEEAISFLSKVMDRLGCETIYIGCSETILNRNFPEPSLPRLSLISELVTAAGADMGVYLDNDQDRIIFISEKGEIIRDQEAIGIFASSILEDNPGGTVVSSVVASTALDEIVTKYEGKLIKTSLDHVLKEIIENKAVFGADEPGMYVFPHFQCCFDGIYGLVMMLGILAKKDLPISKLVEQVPKYFRTSFTVECEHEKKIEVIEQLESNYRDKYDIETVDGLRIDFDDSFFLIRPSRFEPIIRVYMESKSPDKLQMMVKSLKVRIDEIIAQN